MNEKLLDILKPQGDCIPEEMLLRYAKGVLSAHESRKVEEHLTECEFCSDALDGLMKSGDIQHYHARVTSAKHSLRKKMGLHEERKMFPFTRALAVAATVMLLAVSAWFVQYMIQNETQKVFTDQFEPYPAAKMDSLMPPALTPAITESATARSESKSKKGEEVKALKQVVADENPAERTKEEFSEAESAPAVSAPAIEEKKPDLNSASRAKVYADDADSNVVVTADVKKEDAKQEAITIEREANQATTLSKISGLSYADEEAMKRAQFISEHLNRGMEFYGGEKYVEALAEFQLVLKQDAFNATANFYSGVSALALANAKEALGFFHKTDNKNNQFFEASLWYEALANVKLGDKKEASKLLEKVIGINGQYKSQAEQILKEL